MCENPIRRISQAKINSYSLNEKHTYTPSQLPRLKVNKARAASELKKENNQAHTYTHTHTHIYGTVENNKHPKYEQNACMRMIRMK